MPIPKPGKNEKEDEFISRCMGDDVMVKEYPDEKVRAGICYSQWKDKGKKKDSDETEKEKSSESLQIERMVLPGSELRVMDGKTPKLAGYAAVFDSLSEDLWGMREKIDKGAFANTIKTDDVRMLWNHDPNYILARNKSGTLKLWEDDKGLAFEAIPPDTQFAKDLIKSIKRGDVSQNSFGFTVKRHEWDEDKQVRTLKEVRLYDVSPVVFPAYPQTEIYVRSKFTEKRIILENLKEEKQEEVKKFFRTNEYFVAPGIYSISQPDPTAVVVDNSTDKKEGADRSHVDLVEPKIPLVDPTRYLSIKNKIRRYQ